MNACTHDCICIHTCRHAHTHSYAFAYGWQSAKIGALCIQHHASAYSIIRHHARRNKPKKEESPLVDALVIQHRRWRLPPQTGITHTSSLQRIHCHILQPFLGVSCSLQPCFCSTPMIWGGLDRNKSGYSGIPLSGLFRN